MPTSCQTLNAIDTASVFGLELANIPRDRSKAWLAKAYHALLGMPVTPITGMVVKDQDLVLATQGRSFWILDDLTPLRQLDEAAEATAFLFGPRHAFRLRLAGGGRGGVPTRAPGAGGTVEVVPRVWYNPDLLSRWFYLPAVLALILMMTASRCRSRITWIAGSVLIGATVLKLFIVDLANSGTIERIVSFLAVGILLMVIGWGSTYGAVHSAVTRMIGLDKPVAQLHLRHLNPFPSNLGEVLNRFERVLVPELNMGQLAFLLRAQHLVEAIPYTKVQGKPFKHAELKARMEELCSGGKGR